MIPIPTPIYHITHVGNLAAILVAGGLKSYTVLRQAGASHTNIAHESIQDRRAKKRVPCGPGGTLHAYVPFYFAPRPPMLYTLHRGNVTGYTEGQEPIIHMVSTAQDVVDCGLRFVFTNGHGIMILTDFFDDLSALHQIDWKLMRSRYWADTGADQDRCRRRQAEFLVHQFFPWNLVKEIGVMNDQIGAKVRVIIANVAYQPLVRVRRGWYY